MSRYRAMFDRCSAQGQAVFGGFLLLGDPSPQRCESYLDALVEGGADMVELGIPFSDPVAAFRARHPAIPMGVLTYANIVAARGGARFALDLAEAGADSLLVADVPSIEAAPYARAARSAGIDLVM